jgi:hypothetical protein
MQNISHRASHRAQVHTFLQRFRKYRSGLLCATLIVYTPTCHTRAEFSVSQSQLWTASAHMAAGDDFLALGYARGLEVWDWEVGAAPARRDRWNGDSVTALAAAGNQVFWTTASGQIHSGTISNGMLAAGWSDATAGIATDISWSSPYLGVAVNQQRARIWDLQNLALAPIEWTPPGASAVVTVSIRDSTLAVAGANRLWLVRLRSDTAIVLDSTDLGAFVYTVDWVGDTLIATFGFSGLKMATTSSDRFDVPPVTLTPPGSYGHLARWDGGWAALDLFGQIQIFERGGAFTPAVQMHSGGTLQTAAGRGDELCVVTAEGGIATINLFSLHAPYWDQHVRKPGFARALHYSLIGMLAYADFSGVYALDPQGERWIAEHPYNALDLDVQGDLVASSSYLGGGALFSTLDTSVTPASLFSFLGLGHRMMLLDSQLLMLPSFTCDSAVTVYNISNPAQPVQTDQFSICRVIRDAQRIPGAVALVTSDSNLWVYSTPLTSNPVPSSRIADTVAWDQLEWHSDMLWSYSDRGIAARWTWNNGVLTEADRHTLQPGHLFAVHGTRLVNADASNNVRVWDWSPGSTPVIVDTFVTRYPPGAIAMIGDTVWIVDRNAVLRYDVEVSSSIGDDRERSFLPEFTLLKHTYPNPFNGRVKIELALSPGDWTVDVFDVLGRHVRHWNGYGTHPGPTTLIWAPDSHRAEEVASGMFFIRATNAGTTETRKVLYLK